MHTASSANLTKRRRELVRVNVGGGGVGAGGGVGEAASSCKDISKCRSIEARSSGAPRSLPRPVRAPCTRSHVPQRSR
eukprot:4203065-Pleurochrysis_carterae.AAC.1